MILDRAWRLGRALEWRATRARRATTHAGYRRYLDALSFALAAPAEQRDLLALDLETDGLDAGKSAIVQVGYVPLRLGGAADVLPGVRLGEARQVLVRGTGSLADDSVVVHGITDARRESGVTLAQALEQTLEAITGRVLVAHCAGVERAFLDAACRTVCGAPFVGATICTLELERRWFPRPRTADGLRLGKLRSAHGLPSYPAHDALTDALACAELLLAQVAARRSRGLRLVDLIERV